MKNNLINSPLTNTDINKFFPGVSIVPYPEISKADKIKDITSNKYNACFILYVNDKNNNVYSGHWNLLIKDGDTCLLFDPYGGYIDNNLKIIGPSRSDYNEDDAYLSELLLKDKDIDRIFYNNNKYQSEGAGIQTCGRHCSFRLICYLNGIKSEKEYKNLLEKLKKKYKTKNFDDLIIKFIN